MSILILLPAHNPLLNLDWMARVGKRMFIFKLGKPLQIFGTTVTSLLTMPDVLIGSP